MILTDDEDFEKLLETEPNAVRYEKVDNRILLTASTEELQKFVIKYADDERVFGNEIILRRKEAAELNEPAAEEPNSVGAVGADPNTG